MVVNVLSLISLISLSLLFARLRFASNASKNARLFKKKHKENKRDYDDDLPSFTTKEERCVFKTRSLSSLPKRIPTKGTLFRFVFSALPRSRKTKECRGRKRTEFRGFFFFFFFSLLLLLFFNRER